MSVTIDNHYVPQWHQKGFTETYENKLCFQKIKVIKLPNQTEKKIESRKWCTPAQRFYEKHLYSIFFGTQPSDEIEKKLFGPIDEYGSKAIKAFLTNDESLWHENFIALFRYLDAQKLRTPKGLDWIKSKFSNLNQSQLMTEMQALNDIHTTIWTEGVREFVSAEHSQVKFILSDHPITIYNYALSPTHKDCIYPNDPDISLKGSQTIFPLSKDRCLILTNLEYAKDPDGTNPLEQRTNATRIRESLVSTINFINTRKLTDEEVTKINYIIKSCAKDTIAAGSEAWLSPEEKIQCEWEDLRYVLLPPAKKVYGFDTQIYAQYSNGHVHYQDALGRTVQQTDFLKKNIAEKDIKVNQLCGCGSGKKYKKCCESIKVEFRTSWKELSIRERNLAFFHCIADVLGLENGKSWLDIRYDLTETQIKSIYSFYKVLWPRETDIYSLLPKRDGKFRGLYTGFLDVRVIDNFALPMASIFDEYLIQSPIMNPNNIKSEFSPITSTSNYKYQALKDFLFIIKMAPYIEQGLVNLIPDPGDFDLNLMKAMFSMAGDRKLSLINPSTKDAILNLELVIEDTLNSIALAPLHIKVQALSELGLKGQNAYQIIEKFEKNIAHSPFALLQNNSERRGQFFQYCMGPNYEMSLFIAQITGSVLVTDSNSRWGEFEKAQHSEGNVIKYPWDDVLKDLKNIPLDYDLVENFRKSQKSIDRVTRGLLKSIDKLILEKNCDNSLLNKMNRKVDYLNNKLKWTSKSEIKLSPLKILSPHGGIYDSNVHRLLIRSSCTSYDKQVRSVYGLNL